MKLQVIICSQNQFKTKQGIPLNNPDHWYLVDAFQTAKRDGFKMIYCHYKTVGAARYVLPYDVLGALFTWKDEVDTLFCHPAKIKETA